MKRCDQHLDLRVRWPRNSAARWVSSATTVPRAFAHLSHAGMFHGVPLRISHFDIQLRDLPSVGVLLVVAAVGVMALRTTMSSSFVRIMRQRRQNAASSTHKFAYHAATMTAADCGRWHRPAVVRRTRPLVSPLGGSRSTCPPFRVSRSTALSAAAPGFSEADQVARFAAQVKNNDRRALDIDSVFDPEALRGKTVVVTGANRGIGLSLARELSVCGAHVIGTCRRSSQELDDLRNGDANVSIFEGVDVTDDSSCERLAHEIPGTIDVLINNAGYFKAERESVLDGTMDFTDEVMTIDICAVGPLRVSTALFRAGKLAQGSKIAMITSQGGSVEWRAVQCPEGGDYGHHMSKAAANMGAVLLANELRGKGVAVGVLHPGFNRTEMTSKYSHIWDVEGAVEPSVGAKRVLHEINVLSMETSGRFINCEDGLQIPW